MKFTLNRAEAEIKGFSEPGTYNVAIVACKEAPLDKNGDGGVILRYRADDGRSINDRFSLKETMLWRINALAAVTNVEVPDGESFDFSVPGAFTDFLSRWVGQRLKITLEQDGQYLRIRKLEKADPEPF